MVHSRLGIQARTEANSSGYRQLTGPWGHHSSPRSGDSLPLSQGEVSILQGWHLPQRVNLGKGISEMLACVRGQESAEPCEGCAFPLPTQIQALSGGLGYQENR